MNAAVYRGTSSLNLPPTQNTAPVLDFNCLYTHDLRRKQKRWQDGFLRYHTFNKRIMVYDVPRNYVGDTHWTTGEELQDGDEVMLEKDGVLVQVADSIGRTETDLTELRRSAKKGATERGSSPPVSAAQTPTPRLVASRPVTVHGTRAPTQLKHRSLNALLGTPKGPIGKAALPTKSPFEVREREAENTEWEHGRPPKKRRIESHRGRHAVDRPSIQEQNERKDSPALARATDLRPRQTTARLKKSRPATKVDVDLTEDHDEDQPQKFLQGFSSDALHPLSSPLRQQAPIARSSPPAFQTQRLPDGASRRLPSEEHIQLGPKSAKALEIGHQLHAAGQRQPAQTQQRPNRGHTGNSRTKSTRAVAAVTEEQPSSRAGQILRMSTVPSKKKTLFCQEQLSHKFQRTASTDTEIAASVLLNTNLDDDAKVKEGTQQRKLQARLAQIDEKATRPRNLLATVSVEKRKVDCENGHGRGTDGDGTAKANSYEISAYQLALLDQSNLPNLIRAAIATTEEEENVVGITTARADPDTPLQPSTVDGALVSKGSPRANSRLGLGNPASQEIAGNCAPAVPDSHLVQRSSAIAAQPPAARSSKEASRQPWKPGHTLPASPLAIRKDDRPFRRVVSETSTLTDGQPKRIPGAPMKFTHSMSKLLKPSAGPSTRPAVVDDSAKMTNPKVSNFKAKKPLQRAVTYNVTANGTATVMLGRPFQPPKPPSEIRDTAPPPMPDPWSREAFDLFTWRPPGWDEEQWCVKVGDGDGKG